MEADILKGEKKLLITIPAIVTGIVIALVSIGALALVKEREKQAVLMLVLQKMRLMIFVTLSKNLIQAML